MDNKIREFHLISDACGVQIGSDDFAILIHCGNEDGYRHLYVCEEEIPEHIKKRLTFETNFKGRKVKIYYEDGDHPQEKPIGYLSGRYGVYTAGESSNELYFERWDDIKDYQDDNPFPIDIPKGFLLPGDKIELKTGNTAKILRVNDNNVNVYIYEEDREASLALSSKALTRRIV